MGFKVFFDYKETESYQNKEQYKKESYPRFFNPPVKYIENKKKWVIIVK